MSAILYWSSDNGQLYDTIDDQNDPSFSVIEIPNHVVFTPAQLTVQDGDILEALLASGQARVLREAK